MYTAIVLNRQSQNLLADRLSVFVEQLKDWQDWELLCHHCTLAFGRVVGTVGQSRELTVDAFAFNGLVAAFRVRGADDSQNKVPHVTALVNRVEGGTPKMSNDLTDWRAIQPIKIMGRVEICN